MKARTTEPAPAPAFAPKKSISLCTLVLAWLHLQIMNDTFHRLSSSKEIARSLSRDNKLNEVSTDGMLQEGRTPR